MPDIPGTLVDYLREYQQAITARVHDQAPPRWTPGEREADPLLQTAIRRPFPAQRDVIMAAAKTLDHEPGVYVCGEMGTGKTLIGALVPWIHHRSNTPRTLVMCPGHLCKKWKREILDTVPGALAEIIYKGSDAVRLVNRPRPDKPEFWIMSKETAKLGYFKRAAARSLAGITERGNAVVHHGKHDPQTGIKTTVYNGTTSQVITEVFVHCPECGKPIEKPAKTANGLPTPITLAQLESKPRHCRNCAEQEKPKRDEDGTWTNPKGRRPRHTALWTADRTKQRKFAIADYFKRQKVRFDYLIADEVHELKGSDTAQGNALGTLGSCAKKIIALTGTLIGGKATHLYYLNYRMNAHMMRRAGFRYGNTARWVDQYGIREIVIRETKSADGERNTRSHGSKDGTHTGESERPGISPALFGDQLLNSAIFVHLEDVAHNLPPCTEQPTPIDMEPLQAKAYKALELKIKSVMDKQLAMGNRKLLSLYLQTLLSYPDKPFGNEPLTLEKGYQVEPPELPQDVEYPKERELIRIAHEAKTRGRKTLVYLQNTGKRDLLPRIKEVLTRYGIKAEYMRSTLSPKRREDWIRKKAPDLDALILNPELVKTGLDLIEFPTIVFLQTGYNVFTVRQASRRSRRIGQIKPVEVYYLYYTQTMQARAVNLIGRKISASAALDGKLTEEGLIALAGDDEDAAMQLARALCNGGLEDENSIESYWRKPEDVEAAEKPDEPEPQPAQVLMLPTAAEKRMENLDEQPEPEDPDAEDQVDDDFSFLPHDDDATEREAGEAEARAAYDYIPQSAKVPKLYTTEKEKDPLVRVKLFCPWSSWTWYITEYDPKERLAFGLVDGWEKEIGYISLDELSELRGGPGGQLRIERDIHWKPTPLSVIRDGKPQEDDPEPEPTEPEPVIKPEGQPASIASYKELADAQAPLTKTNDGWKLYRSPYLDSTCAQCQGSIDPDMEHYEHENGRRVHLECLDAARENPEILAPKTTQFPDTPKVIITEAEIIPTHAGILATPTKETIYERNQVTGTMDEVSTQDLASTETSSDDDSRMIDNHPVLPPENTENVTTDDSAPKKQPTVIDLRKRVEMMKQKRKPRRKECSEQLSLFG